MNESIHDTKTDRLRRRVRDAREQHGPRAARWPQAARNAKVELARRGADA